MSYSGKQFEKDIEKSFEDHIWYYKLRDAGGWSNGSNTRFTTSNICDYFAHNGITKRMFAFELKKTNSKSLPFSNIKTGQISGLEKAKRYFVNSGFIINLNGDVFYLDIDDFVSFINTTERKSIPLSYLEEKGIRIPSRKLKKYYRYDLSEVMEIV